MAWVDIPLGYSTMILNGFRRHWIRPYGCALDVTLAPGSLGTHRTLDESPH